MLVNLWVRNVEIYQIALGALALVVLTNLAVLSPLRRRIESDPHTNVLARQCGYAVANAVKLIAATVLLSCILVFALLALIGFREGTRAREVERTIHWLQSLRDQIQDVEPIIGLITLGLIVIALLYVSYRQSRMRVGNAIEKARAAELQALAEQAEVGDLPQLPATEVMRKIEQQLQLIDTELQDIIRATAEEQEVVEGGEVLLNPARASRVSELQQTGQKLSQIHLIEDFNRRISGRLNEGDVQIAAPRTFLGKVGTFFISTGNLRGMRWLSRTVFLLGILLIVPSLLAISTPSVADAMDDRLNALEDVYVALQQEEAIKSWNNYRTRASTPDALDASDAEAISRAAVALEFALAQRAAGALKLDAFVNRATLRAQGTRIRLFRAYNKRVEKLGMQVSMRGFAQDADLSELHRAIVEFELDAAMVPERPSTSAGRAFAQNLEDAVPEMDPGRWAAAKQQIDAQWADFQRISSRQQLRSLFVTHIMFDGVAPAVPADDAVSQFVNNIEDLVPLDRRKAMLAASQSEFLATLETQGLTQAVDHVGDATRPHPFGRNQLDELFINAQSFAGNDGFDRELRNFSPYLDEVTDARVNRAAAEKLARTMATSSVAEGFQLVDPLASLVQFSDVRSGSGPTRVARKPYTPPRRVSRLSSKPRFRIRFRR